jgi:hypothetical protein
MTLLVGILCTDGIVIAADQAVTFGPDVQRATIQHAACKISIVADQVIIAMTGQVGLAQRYIDIFQSNWAQLAQAPTTDTLIHTQLCSVAQQNFRSTGAPPHELGGLVGMARNGQLSLCEYLGQFQPEMKTGAVWFASTGSGQLMADAYLALVRDTLWQQKQPSLNLGILGAAWVMDRSIIAAPRYIGPPINIAVIAKNDGGAYAARMLEQADVDEHLVAVRDSIRYLGDFKPTKQDADSAPEMPEPPASEAPPDNTEQRF